ncbi:MAG TPA: P-loop NTPase fold protein [Actinokineospora sp.]|nr:P-loop NTPase fold protein [Actinokineospora sp.]
MRPALVIDSGGGHPGRVIEAEREALFDELLTNALADPEVLASSKHERAPSPQWLRETARAHRFLILGQVIATEDDYRLALTQEHTGQAKRRAVKFAAVVAGIVLVLTPLGLGVLSNWSNELRDGNAASPPRGADLGSAVGMGALIGLVYLIASVGVGALVWLAFTPWSGVAERRPDALRNRRLWAFVIPTTLLGVMVVFGSGGVATRVALQLASPQPLPEHVDQPAWAWVLTLGTAVLLLAAGALVAQYLLEPPSAPVELGVAEAKVKLADWRTALRGALLSFLRGQISARISISHATTLRSLENSTGLRKVRGPTIHVPTPAWQQLATIAAGMDSGSIALSGPRGVGKTDLLNEFCVNAKDQVGIVVNVPVVFDRREFMLHLFDRVCGLAIKKELDARNTARARLDWIRYLQTRSGETTVGAGWLGFSLGGKRGVSQARQPLTYPEIVESLKDFLAEIARELRASDAGRRLVIGIDELDRIEPIARARDFLNEVKAIFDVVDCLFVLSVSDEALQEADLAQAGKRDAFDSAIDEVIRMEPLTYQYSVRLLGTRAIGLPEPFIALFHCLSGGMPRDLLRTARAAATQTSSARERTLAEITHYLVGRDLDRGIDGGADFRDTVLAIFAGEITSDDLRRAAEPNFPGSFDALAAAQRGLTEPAGLEKIRQAWRLPELIER